MVAYIDLSEKPDLAVTGSRSPRYAVSAVEDHAAR